MKYSVFLDERLIGMSDLEKADVPMGVVFGDIHSLATHISYSFLKGYCQDHQITADTRDEDQFISTQIIPGLTVKNEQGIIIKGEGSYISGDDHHGYETGIHGVSRSVFEQEFPHHIEAENNRFQ